MPSAYKDILDELINSDIAMGAPGMGQLSSHPTTTEEVMGVAQAIDPQLLPMGKALPLVAGMTKWKKMLPIFASNWNIENYPSFIQKLKRSAGLAPVAEFAPQKRFTEAKNVVSAIREKEKALSAAKAARKRLDLREVGKESPIGSEAISEADYEIGSKKHGVKMYKDAFERLKKTVGSENVYQPKKQIPTLRDKRKLTGQTRARDLKETLSPGNRNYTSTHKENTKKYYEEKKLENFPRAWRNMLEELRRKKPSGE